MWLIVFLLLLSPPGSVDRNCDKPTCQVTCDSSYQVCNEFVCTGTGCPGK